ncbi:MAG: indolepyruvate ferredoxin oxidoreductase family protein, partial [Solirubrobacteraceae bacterium]
MATIAPAAPSPHPGAGLEDRFTAEGGRVLISGIQSIVRLMLDHRALDRARGHTTGMFVSGYQGSPLAGLDRELHRNADRLSRAGVVFRPGLNEELAATAVAGTQVLEQLDRRTVDGVAGFWFGKNPGLDRAADALRHANLVGTSPLGGAVALIGDDPASKSSTVPSTCEPMCRSLMMPLLAPGSVEELLRLGPHAVELSRHSGAWVGLKIVADVADASATVDLSALGHPPELEPRPTSGVPVLLPPTNLDAELDLMEHRLDRARAYAQAAELNRITFEPARPQLALVAAGVRYQSLLRALADLGIDRAAREALGIRLVQIGMPWPVDRTALRRLTDGVERVLVVEDKLPFLESELKEALYRAEHTPLVLGKRDAEDRPLLPARGALDSDDVARAIGRLLGPRLDERARHHLERLGAAPGSEAPLPARVPYFCSGCPHNTSTRAQPGELVGAGIGCHTMVLLDDSDRHGEIVGLTQMGGEGAQWIGLAPFTDDPHFVQNMGDGTFHHSGSLAVRAAVAAGVSITYRLLYNDAVAMTGGQHPEGQLPIPALTRWLALEGVRRVVITTPEPERYQGVGLDPIASVRHRDELQAAQGELRELGSVTVLVHDDQCATEKRRMRKRGTLPTPAERVWINERVCEGCGDCGEKSTCLSVRPVETEFGRKTRIHQSSCNFDFSCVQGDCPAFVLVRPGDGRPPAAPAPVVPFSLAEPVRRTAEDVLVRLPGVGGTGVVTVSAILQMAAHLDGRSAAAIEQTGLA